LLTGRTEIRIFLALYALTLPFQLLTTGAVLEQGSTALVVLTAIHAGFVAALFWSLLANGLVATQVVEDGTLSSLVVRYLRAFFCLYGRDAKFHSIGIALRHIHARFLRRDNLYLA
jgi:hypothetical protein